MGLQGGLPRLVPLPSPDQRSERLRRGITKMPRVLTTHLRTFLLINDRFALGVLDTISNHDKTKLNYKITNLIVSLELFMAVACHLFGSHPIFKIYNQKVLQVKIEHFIHADFEFGVFERAQ